MRLILPPTSPLAPTLSPRYGAAPKPQPSTGEALRSAKSAHAANRAAPARQASADIGAVEPYITSGRSALHDPQRTSAQQEFLRLIHMAPADRYFEQLYAKYFTEILSQKGFTEKDFNKLPNDLRAKILDEIQAIIGKMVEERMKSNPDHTVSRSLDGGFGSANDTKLVGGADAVAAEGAAATGVWRASPNAALDHRFTTLIGSAASDLVARAMIDLASAAELRHAEASAETKPPARLQPELTRDPGPSAPRTASGSVLWNDDRVAS